MARPTKSAIEQSRLSQVKNLVEYLKDKHVKRVVVDGIELEFDTAIAAIDARERAAAVEQDKARKSDKLEKLDSLLHGTTSYDEDELYHSVE